MISDRMVDAFNQAHNAAWEAAAPVTQGDAVTVHRQAVRAGLEAALAARPNVFPKPPLPPFIKRPTCYEVVRLPGEWAYSVQDPDKHYRIRAALDALTAAGWQKTPADDPRHIIEFRATGWTLKHPLSCRHGDLWGCAVNRAAEEMDSPPAEPGRYAVHVDGIDGRLRVDERVEA
ncbi:DUF6085 family protein [Micromonospora chalcea]|uniref:DUF6085 family protein n=1 Tax=Micromonospora chalcea TaxID=1874 RepID=UPI00382AC3E4